MMTTITCPYCKKSIELTEALTHQIQEELIQKEQEKHEREIEEIREKLKVAEHTELELRKEKNKLDEEKRTFELDKQRQLDAEREKIRQKTLEESSESQRLKDKEKDKIIDDLKKSLEDAQRKATQGSQQLQGEVQELELEKILPETIKTDTFEPIPKGVLGADIREIVKTQRGNKCGTILWESKRTKAWDTKWITKLKEDRLRDKANVAAIVSNVLPENVKSGMGCVDGVWVCTFQLVIPLALLLHKAIEDAARERFISDRRQTDAEQIYNIVTGHEFVQQVESMMETYNGMLEQITKERSAFEKSWALRETQILRLRSGVSGIVGRLQDAGGTALSSIKGMELPSGEEVE